MTRHGRNATANSVYSYHERRKDQRQSGFGTLHERLGADSIKEFDCCCLTLQPCREPVVSNDGYLFDKEAILEYILQQKKENARKLKEWEKQRRKDEVEAAELARAEKEAKAKKFARQEATPAHPGSASLDDFDEIQAESSGSASSSAATSKVVAKTLPSFWVPSAMPTAEETKMEKPDQKVYCPMSKKPLKLKDLTPVIFTVLKDGNEDKKDVAKKTRYMCPITHDVLTNVTPCAVLRTSGHVVTMDCIEEIIKKDWIDPTNGKPVTPNDIICLQRGGTGFASTNEGLDAKLARPVLELQ